MENFADVHMENFADVYEKNRIVLNSYRWRRHDSLPSYTDLSVKAIWLEGNVYSWVAGEKAASVKIERTKINTKPFFRDLSKPLLVKNEFNGFHFEYLVDNVRASEDYGADNHIYMYYDSFEKFYLLLQIVDITPYLKDEKLIFLVGKKELADSYPLDFKKEYGLDYESKGSRPVRVNEIKRLVMHWHNSGFSGNVFWNGVVDWHKNLLTIKEFGLVGIHYLYQKILKNHTVEQVYDLLQNNESTFVKSEFDALFADSFSGDTKVPSVEIFFSKLSDLFPQGYCPEEDEWLKGMFLAYGIALGKELNQRIAPAVAFHTHSRSVAMNMDENKGWMKKFKYFRCISLLRRSTIVAASQLEFWDMLRWKYKHLQQLDSMDAVISLRWQDKPIGAGYSMPIYCMKDNEYLPFLRIVRFEDMKLHPRATLDSVLDFFDIEWDDSLLRTTANGQSETWFESESPVKDFDPAPVLRKRERMIAPFDYYRLELLMGDMLEPWGYKPQYYTHKKKYSPKKIMDLFDKPFKCEAFNFTFQQRKTIDDARERLRESVRERMDRSSRLASDGTELVPVPWLKPNLEYIDGKLYE